MRLIIMKLKERYVSLVPGYSQRYSNRAPCPMNLMVLGGYEHMNYNYPFGCAQCVHPLKK